MVAEKIIDNCLPMVDGSAVALLFSVEEGVEDVFEGIVVVGNRTQVDWL